MKIVVLTYDNHHRKTQDLLINIKLKTDFIVEVIATPWVERENYVSLFKHRPSLPIDTNIKDLCHKFDYNLTYTTLTNLSSILNKKSFDFILIGGAGILSKEIVINYKIINSHPGYLPYTKGLDSLKWAIYDENIIGVTTHLISDKTDEGFLIERREVPIFFEDTFHSFALRVYNYEIDMLVNSPIKVNSVDNLKSLADNSMLPHRRMSKDKERVMIKKFDKIRKNSISIQSTKKIFLY